MCLLSVFSAAVSLVGVSHPFIVSRSKEIAKECASLISCIGVFIGGALGSGVALGDMVRLAYY